MNVERIEIAKLKLEPGDIVVVRTKEFLSHEQSRYLHDKIKSVLPPGYRCVLLTGGLELSVLTKAEIERRADAGIANGCD